MKICNLKWAAVSAILLQATVSLAIDSSTDELPDAPSATISNYIQTLSVRVIDLQNASDARKEQAVQTQEALTGPGDCESGKTEAQCFQQTIALDQSKLKSVPLEEAISLQGEISALQLKLSAPETLNEAAETFAEASKTLELMIAGLQVNGSDTSVKAPANSSDALTTLTQMVAKNDFSFDDHLIIIAKSLLSAWKELITPGPIVAMSAGMAGYGVARLTPLNTDAKNQFAAHPTPTILNDIGNQVGYGYPVLAPFLIVALVTKNNSTMTTFDELAVGSALSQIIVEPLKYLVAECRPNGSDCLGFPSGHSAESFMMATILDHRYGHKVGVLAFIAASGVGLIRVGQNLHSPGEVSAGAGLGVATGIAAYRAVEAQEKSSNGKKASFLVRAVTGDFSFKGKDIHCVPVGLPGGVGGSCLISSEDKE